MDTVEIIRQNLSAIGEDYDSLKPFMKKWLEKVETAIQSRKSIQEEAVSTLKSVDYSVKAIAAEIGASRTTIYNHEQLLKRYYHLRLAGVPCTYISFPARLRT